MKTRLALLAAMVGLVFAFQPLLAQDCSFQLGFKALHELIPDVVGDCLDDEQHNPATGITQQPTTNGQLTWRKADNWTEFSDGQRTWINGPQGLQQRLNSERLPWESAMPAPTAAQRLTLEQLRNAEYRLPLLGDPDTPIRLVDGMGTLVYGEGATERETVGLIDDAVAFGDLDGDGNADAAVVVYTSGGGSGAFIYLAAVLDRDGAPSQAARAYLGDRVRVESLRISDGQVLVQILAHGPGDGLCCPSVRTTSTFALREGGLLQQRLTLDQLRNAEYRLPLLGDEDTPIQFTDGEGQIAFGEGATERIHAGIVNDTVAFGDLDGDGIADAAVIVFISGGGSGTFIHLVAMLDRDGAPEQAAWAFLGDRVPVRNLAVTGGRIVARIVTHRPSDGLCCPTLEITRTFGLEGDQLVPRQALVIESPLPGETVASGVEVRGTASTYLSAESLAYLVYDARSGVIGMGSLPVDGYADQPGTFAAPVEFIAAADGPGRIEIIDVDAGDGSALARTAVTVILQAAPLTDGRTSREPTSELVLEAPLSGATVDASLELRGRISAMPFEKNLTYRIYTQAGTLIDQSWISVDGDYGGPGTFTRSIDLPATTAPGPLRIEVRDESVVDGALIGSTSVEVFFTGGS
ncbi:MAG: hypothetical protein F4Y02_08275 [Chloroflexi bacterium]|nr:hypothetical protein [Chloroflexota bacterium]